MRKKGTFVCIEGLDQSGKKTQVGLLIKRLEEQGIKAKKIAFPDYNTPLGKEIKAFLIGNREYSVHVRHILYAANRWERKEDVEKWLDEESLVVADRYSPSNLAYGLANGLDLNWLLNLEKGLPEADLVIVINSSPEASFNRKSRGRDVYERNLPFLRKVREAYIQLSQKFCWIILDGEESIKNIQCNIWKSVSKYLSERP